MAALTPDQRRIAEALLHDIAATLAPAHASALASEVQQHAIDLARQYDWTQRERGAFAAELVDDVQQRIHDEFLDVSWPRCPLHPHHPLWLDAGQWRCTRDNVCIAALGALS